MGNFLGGISGGFSLLSGRAAAQQAGRRRPGKWQIDQKTGANKEFWPEGASNTSKVPDPFKKPAPTPDERISGTFNDRRQ